MAVFTALENCGYQVGVPCGNSASTYFDSSTSDVAAVQLALHR